MSDPIIKVSNLSITNSEERRDVASSKKILSLVNLLSTKDFNKDGRVDLKEYLSDSKGRLLRLTKLGRLNLAKEFKFFDTDADGAISVRDDSDGDAKVTRKDGQMRSSTQNSFQPFDKTFPSQPMQLNLSASREHSFMMDKLAQIKSSEIKLKTDYDTLTESIGLVGYAVLKLHDLPISNLSPQLEGLTILNLSDLHFNRRSNHKMLPELKALIAELPKPPELIIVTGDFLMGGINSFSEEVTSFLKELFPNVPKIAVLGNHDYLRPNTKFSGSLPHRERLFSDGNAVVEKLEEAGFTVLRNETIKLKIRNMPVNIMGVEDWSMGLPDKPQAPIAPSNELAFMLSHNADGLDRSDFGNYDVVFTGHTHSAEVSIPFTGINGTVQMKRTRDFINLNNHIRGFKPLSWRTMLYTNPGFERRLGFRTGPDVEAAAIVLHTLVNYPK